MPETLRLRVRHVTTYDYSEPLAWGLLRLRLRPKPHRLQRILSWDLRLEGARIEVSWEDHHRNAVDLVSAERGATRLSATCEGEVEVTDAAGVLGPHGGFAPLWLFERQTPLTAAGPQCRRLLARLRGEADLLLRLHDLKNAVADAVRWSPGISGVGWTAEDALAEGRGVCQDQAHVFVACARAMGVPARYVSGYLLMPDRDVQEASHAWAEAWLPDLGWVGFDPANRISPDARYVRLATGLDYAEAAPVSGTRHAAGEERLSVHVEVQAQ